MLQNTALSVTSTLRAQSEMYEKTDGVDNIIIRDGLRVLHYI